MWQKIEFETKHPKQLPRRRYSVEVGCFVLGNKRISKPVRGGCFGTRTEGEKLAEYVRYFRPGRSVIV